VTSDAGTRGAHRRAGGTAGHPERLVFAVVLTAVAAIWAVSIAYALQQRARALENADHQLTIAASTLADFNELAEISAGSATKPADARRAAAIWRVLLQYPAASIWIESKGVTTARQPPAGNLTDDIQVREERGDFVVHAALPRSEALAQWRLMRAQGGGLLVTASLTILLLTQFLMRAQQQRAAAERDAAAARERAQQLAQYRAQLEQTVAERTGELREANALLNVELGERKAAEAALREHDALLNVVTRGAGELLGTHSIDEAIPGVLELIGQTVAVGRVQLNAIEPDRDGHLRSSLRYEWCAPGSPPMLDHPALQNIDLTMHYPKPAAAPASGSIAAFFVDEIGEPYRGLFTAAQMRSFLRIPVLPDGRLWGSVDFVDSADAKRQWSWAETDTLKTLAGLIGTAVSRARYVKELADANMIVQNSPTILYRLQGGPSLRLTYVSPNVTKFGHQPAQLVGSADWLQRLVHPDDQAKVAAAMKHILDENAAGAAIEFRLVTGDGGSRWVENRYTLVRNGRDRLVEVEGIIIDITERKAAEEKIALLARTDPLTGLANRATFGERLRQAFAAARRGAGPFAVFYLDFDHFKNINDTLGHAVGDELLQQVAERLKGALRETDLVARLGGDEFAILQMEMGEPANAGALAAKIRSILSQPYRLGGHELQLTTSIGICPYAADSNGPEQMLMQADLALYRAKDEGRDRYCFHSADLDHQVLERVSIAEELTGAMRGEELELHYQPQVDLGTGRIVGMEALLRWRHPQRGLLYPGAFLIIAEKAGVVPALGRWVLDRACAQMKAWRDAALAPPVIAVNLSLAEIKTGRELVRTVADTIAKRGLDPADLEFDVTEASLVQATWAHSDVLAQLRQIGVKIAIDDFGTDYSFFEYLREYDVDHVKIAQTSVGKALGEPKQAATIHAIIGLARELGIGVIAEGVESEEQRRLLLSADAATEAQGFYFSPAVDAARATELLRQGGIEPLRAAVGRSGEPGTCGAAGR
jgi:diguanylate cyclase (GGDEF)-like protein/PAS domain S-box-containing protein